MNELTAGKPNESVKNKSFTARLAEVCVLNDEGHTGEFELYRAECTTVQKSH